MTAGTGMAAALRRIWERELGYDDFADNDDFFDIGGHSLVMARIQQAIAAELGIEVPMDELFDRASVAALSVHLETAAAPS